jgi:hypothetical protein
MALDSLLLLLLLLVTFILAYFVIKRMIKSPKTEVLEDVEKVSETPDVFKST